MHILFKAAAAGAAALGAARLAQHFTAPSFENRVVLITGGSRGLGLALARRLADEGARLALVARTDEDLAEARRELEASGASVLTIAADVTDREEAERAVALTMARYGVLDVLVNNAGVIQAGPMEAMTDDDYRDAMAVHFWAPHFMTEAAVPHLAHSAAARIVNIASIGGEVAVPHLAPYSASKFALVGYSDASRAALAERGIRVTTVSPGLMRTGSHVNATFKGESEKEFGIFTVMAANPLLSTSADRAARQIVEAARRGQPSLVITLPARLAKAAEGLAPNLVARANELARRLLPDGEPDGRGAVPGHDLDQPAPEPLTAPADRNVPRFNEARG